MDCKICLQKYNGGRLTPRILPNCGHTLCEECAGKLVKGRNMACPFDRVVTVLNNGIKSLPKNYAILDVLEESRNSGPSVGPTVPQAGIGHTGPASLPPQGSAGPSQLAYPNCYIPNWNAVPQPNQFYGNPPSQVTVPRTTTPGNPHGPGWTTVNQNQYGARAPPNFSTNHAPARIMGPGTNWTTVPPTQFGPMANYRNPPNQVTVPNFYAPNQHVLPSHQINPPTQLGPNLIPPVPHVPQHIRNVRSARLPEDDLDQLFSELTLEHAEIGYQVDPSMYQDHFLNNFDGFEEEDGEEDEEEQVYHQGNLEDLFYIPQNLVLEEQDFAENDEENNTEEEEDDEEDERYADFYYGEPEDFYPGQVFW